MIAAVTFSVAAWANALAVAQATDCATTRAVVAAGGAEVDSVAHALRADRSLLACLGEAALLNEALRRSKSRTLLTVALAIEIPVATKNVFVTLRMAGL